MAEAAVAVSRGRLAGTGVGVGAGMITVGAAGYVLLAVAGNLLSSADYAALAMLYLLVNILGPGVFVALEQETGRAVSARVAVGAPTGATVRSAALLGLILFAALAIVVIASAPVLIGRLFNENAWLPGALILGAFGAAAASWTRGVLNGHRRYAGYAVSLLGEGSSRLLPTLLLPLLGLATAASLGYSFAAGTLIAAVITVPWLCRGDSGPPESLPRMARGAGWLVIGTLVSQLMANLGPVVVGLRIDDAPVVAGFASAVVLARVPLFLFSPVQVLLLPGLTQSAVNADFATMTRRIRRILVAVALVGFAGAALAAMVGPRAVQVLFGAEIMLRPTTLALLFASSVPFMAAFVLQPALVALRRHHWVAAGWIAGAAVFLGVALAPGSPVAVVVLAQLAGPAIVVAVMGTGLLRGIGGRASTAEGRQ